MEPEIIKFEDVIRGCIRRWKSILIFTICTTVLSVFVAKGLKDVITYQGNFKVLVKNEYVLDSEGKIIKKDDNLVKNYIELMKTRDFAKNLLERTDLNIKVQDVLSGLDLVNIENSNFIQIKYNSATEEQTEKVLKAMKDELLEVADKDEYGKVTVEENVAVSEKSDMRNGKLIILIGFVGGLGLSSLLSFVLECVNKTFRTKGELERELKRPIIASIPKFKEKNSDENLDFYNTLAADIKFGKMTKDKKIIAVTSSIAGEGTTTTAVNLALALSNSNKTLLIDGNIKKPSISKFLNISETKGLAEVIDKKANLEEVLINFNKNMDVLLAGEAKANSIALFDSLEFDKLIDELNKKYDYIIIDTAPLQLSADSRVISNKCHGTILVVRAEYVKKDIVKNTIENIENLQVRLIGLVFNYGDSFRNKYHNYKI